MKFTIGSKIGESFLKLQQSNPITCFFPCTSLKVKVLCDPKLATFEDIPINKTKIGADKDFSLRDLNEDHLPLNSASLALNTLQTIFDSVIPKLFQSSHKQVGTIYFSGHKRRFTVRVFDEHQTDPIYTLKTSKEQPNQPPKGFLQYIDLFKGKDSEPRTKVGAVDRDQEEGLLAVAVFRPVAASERTVPADGSSPGYRPTNRTRRAAEAEGFD